MDQVWVEDLRDACLASRVPFFFKQWGGRTPKAGGRELDGRTWDEMPSAGTGCRTRNNPAPTRDF
jgi:protein gp37